MYNARALEPGPAFFYGLFPGDEPLLHQAIADGRDWYYCDNGYFRRGNYYRVTRNAWQHDGLGDAGPERWDALGLKIKPWRAVCHGSVLICLQTAHFFAARCENRDAWLDGVQRRLRASTRREIVVREKPKKASPGAFQDTLHDVWTVVARSSNCLIDAALEGVPIVATHACAASVIGSSLETIGEPRYAAREQWAWNLAANQWTLDEIERGVAWRDLSRR